MNSTEPQKKPANRRNIYARNPHLFDALAMAIDKGIIKSRSLSERVEELIGTELRRVAPKMKAAGLSVPEDIFTK